MPFRNPDTIEEEAAGRSRSRRSNPSWGCHKQTATKSAATAAKARPKARPDAAAAKPKPTKSGKVAKPYVQLGIFGVEANAKNTAAGDAPAWHYSNDQKLEMNDKPFWRVIVGPATSQDELKTILDKVKKAGFADAYAVSG